MIISNLTGGLGNQMFQYAFGRYLSIKHHTSLKLHFTNALFNTQYDYALDIFNIKASIATSSDLKKLSVLQNRIANRVFYLLDERFGLQLNPHIITERYPYKFNKEYKNISNNRYVQGYWSHTTYFEEISSVLLKEFTLKQKLDERNTSILSQINKMQSIAIHVRRGDYITNKFGPKFIGLDYYKNAIKKIESRVASPHYFIFSNDIYWCKKNLSPLLSKVTYIDHNTGNNSFKDLVLMSNCKHNITANSTFSWWGAWLNPNENKIIISPHT